MKRIALLHHGSPCSPMLAGFRAGLPRHNLVEGVNCVVDAVGAEGRWHRLPVLTEQLLQRRPDVLVAIGALAALSAQRATSGVPILHAVVVDPVHIGLTASNVTGVSSFDPEQAVRHLRLLQQLVPGLRSVAFLADANAPSGRDGRSPLVSELLAAARHLGLDLHGVVLSDVDEDLERVFHRLLQGAPQALVALEVPTVLARLRDIVKLAECHGLPTLSPYGWTAGGLVMEGASLLDVMEPLAESVARVICGASDGAAATRFIRQQRLVVCLDRALRIGLAIPAAVLKTASLCVDATVGDAGHRGRRAVLSEGKCR